jgi:hypothetical protein
MNEQCREKVGDWHLYRCKNKGKVQRDGQWYCGVHDPIAKAERAAKRGPTQFERECARREKRAAERAALIEVARAVAKVRKAPRFNANMRSLAAIEIALIEETGMGDFAAYVIEFLQEADAVADELRAALDKLPEGVLD